MAYMYVLGSCVGCKTPIMFNADHVPSLRVNGTKEPLCESCFCKWNERHRTSKGLEPAPLSPQAYEPQEVL